MKWNSNGVGGTEVVVEEFWNESGKRSLLSPMWTSLVTVKGHTLPNILYLTAPAGMVNKPYFQTENDHVDK